MTTTATPLVKALQSEGKVLIHSFNAIEIVKLDEILYIQAYGCYCKIFLKDRSPITSSRPFGEIYRMLSPFQLFQSHKSYAINLTHVIRYRNTGQIILSGNVEIPLARRRKEEFLSVLVS